MWAYGVNTVDIPGRNASPTCIPMLPTRRAPGEPRLVTRASRKLCDLMLPWVSVSWPSWPRKVLTTRPTKTRPAEGQAEMSSAANPPPSSHHQRTPSRYSHHPSHKLWAWHGFNRAKLTRLMPAISAQDELKLAKDGSTRGRPLTFNRCNFSEPSHPPRLNASNPPPHRMSRALTDLRRARSIRARVHSPQSPVS
jgi:hypothetical protein